MTAIDRNFQTQRHIHKIALLGMGGMGRRMAQSLLQAGYELTVWDVDAKACWPLCASGARYESTPRAAAAASDLVISMVWDDAAAASVWLDAETGALEAMTTTGIAMECATLSTRHIQRMADQCRQRQIDFVSAPMSGSLPEAENKTLIFIVGAASDVMTVIAPVVQAMGSKIHHAGDALDGMSEKLIINGKLGIEYIAMAEIVALLRAGDMDIDKRMNIMAATAPFSARGLREARFMLQGDYAVRVKIRQMVKDLSYAIEQFEARELPCPLHRVARDVFESALRDGHGDEDATMMHQCYEKRAIEMKHPSL